MVNMTNYEEYMLLYADGELSKEDEQALLAFVQLHPELQAELNAYAATKLQPDTTLVYEDKEALMKTTPGGRTIRLGGWKTYAAAIYALLIFMLFALYRSGEKQIEAPIANNTQETNTELVSPKSDPALAGGGKGDNPIQADKSLSPAGGGTLAKDDAADKATLVQDNNTNHISPKWNPATAGGGKGERVHSTKPVNAVAVETKRNKIQPEPAKDQPVIQEPVKMPKEEIAKAEPVKTIQNKEPEPVVAVKTETEKQPVVIPPAPVDDIIAEAPVKKKNRFIASVLDKKPEILDELGEAVNEKVLIAKNVREQIKDTDVTFKIGKKELFTVRL